ncbi:MAG TPA: hypothetical protein VGF23_14185 [Gaiellaceae bacterium]|jgi:hypothetical protein
MATAIRTTTLTACALALDGHECGFLTSVAGGGVVAPVIEEGGRKTIGTPTVEALTLGVGLGMNEMVYDWIASSWESARPRDVAVVQLDGNLERRLERQYAEALITETTVSAFDASSRNPVTFTLRVAAEKMRDFAAKGKVTPPSSPPRRALACNFRLELGDLDCSRVMSIDSFTVKQTFVADDSIGRIPVKAPISIEIPNLRVTLADASQSQTWRDWFRRFVIEGDTGSEKNGAIVLLTPDLRDEIGRIELSGVGIFGLEEPPMPAPKDAVARFTVELYCEQMTFTLKETSA